eukprot:1880575-Prymnesium_polylepis.1
MQPVLAAPKHEFERHHMKMGCPPSRPEQRNLDGSRQRRANSSCASSGHWDQSAVKAPAPVAEHNQGQSSSCGQILELLSAARVCAANPADYCDTGKAHDCP